MPQGTETTIYVAGLLEKVTNGSGTHYRHYIRGGAGTAAIHSRTVGGANTTVYLHRDHLGSPELITDASGNVLVRPSFAAYGERRDGSDWDGPPSSGDLATLAGISRRGFTGHEHLDAVGLIHMNGRVFEPVAGRFLSVDPYIDGWASSQGPNGYAYAHNNPLTLVDPSGFQRRDATEMQCIDWCVPLADYFWVKGPFFASLDNAPSDSSWVGYDPRFNQTPRTGDPHKNWDGQSFGGKVVIYGADDALSQSGESERLPTTFENGSPLPGRVIDVLEHYFDDFDLTQIRIYSGIPWYVVGNPAAYASKNDIYFAEGFYDPNTARGISLIGHEARHSQQYQELGTFRFRARYLSEYLGGRLRGLGHDEAYRNISLEREAFTLQRRIYFDLIKAGYPR